MAESVERYFRMMSSMRRVQIGSRMWCPAADVYRTRDGWIVKVDLAGVSIDDLEVIISGSSMTIAGCRRDTSFGEGITYHQLEITYSTFEKILKFPCSIEGAALLRDYRDGLLILRLRSSEECDED
jgi:HSP20 family protein